LSIEPKHESMLPQISDFDLETNKSSRVVFERLWSDVDAASKEPMTFEPIRFAVDHTTVNIFTNTNTEAVVLAFVEMALKEPGLDQSNEAHTFLNAIKSKVSDHSLNPLFTNTQSPLGARFDHHDDISRASLQRTTNLQFEHNGAKLTLFFQKHAKISSIQDIHGRCSTGARESDDSIHHGRQRQ